MASSTAAYTVAFVHGPSSAVITHSHRCGCAPSDNFEDCLGPFSVTLALSAPTPFEFTFAVYTAEWKKRVGWVAGEKLTIRNYTTEEYAGLFVRKEVLTHVRPGHNQCRFELAGEELSSLYSVVRDVEGWMMKTMW